jgi:ABC-type anion transport system duplicated permease subunit
VADWRRRRRSSWATFIDLARTGELQRNTLVTLARVAAGFGLGVAVATVLGAATGYFPTLRRLLDPSLQALRAIPSIAWVPLFILWLGIFEASKVTLIAVGVFFPVYLGLMGAIQSVDRKLVEVGRVFRLSDLAMVHRILLPAVLPAYVISLRSGLGLGWMFALVACAGVTLKAVATALDIPLKSSSVAAEGDLDFRGTLGVAKDAPVGFAQIRLRFDLDTDAPQDKLDQLLKLTERYCVVYQTIRNGPPVEIRLMRT